MLISQPRCRFVPEAFAETRERRAESGYANARAAAAWQRHCGGKITHERHAGEEPQSIDAKFGRGVRLDYRVAGHPKCLGKIIQIRTMRCVITTGQMPKPPRHRARGFGPF